MQKKTSFFGIIFFPRSLIGRHITSVDTEVGGNGRKFVFVFGAVSLVHLWNPLRVL